MTTECNPLVEAMLLSYANLDMRCKNIDERALGIAIKSRCMNVYDAIEKITRLYEEKAVYVSVKEIIDDALIHMSAYELIGFYKESKSVAEIQSDSKISERTVWRRLRNQKAMLSSKILGRYSEPALKEIISGSRWLMNIYRECLNERRVSRKARREV